MLQHALPMPYPPPRQPPLDLLSATAVPKFDPPRQLQLPAPRATAWKPLQQISPPDDMGVGAVSNYQLPPVITSAVKPLTPPNTVVQPPAQHAAAEMHHSSAPRASVSPNLRVPSDVATPQESLPQLAAEVTCLFWFEGSATLHQILETTSPRLAHPLCPDAIPTIGFRKWVTTILSTTQVAPNVIILALLFIWRLKSGNPRVKGRPGSEYRLLTVALMLGNKFLDDNTYTNKTWAEVTGISVQEVHVMEVEFLSNMRYNLFTTDAKWSEWKILLGKFGTFCDCAAKCVMQRPRLQLNQPPSRSPPSQASPVSTSSTSPSAHSFSTRTSSATIPPLASSLVNERKRSADHTGEPAPKRVAYGFGPGVYSNAPPLPTLQVPVECPAGVNRLPPLPHLSIPLPPPQQTPPVSVPNNWSDLSLPPPGTRSMAMVYPQPVQWQQSFVTPTSTTAPGYPASQSLTPTGTAVDKSYPVSPYHASPGSSPVNYSAPNSRQLSPSYFLSQRQSPYRPVRGVQTLLVPPPSSSLQSASRNIAYEQMQYQPLGKSNTERRAGPLPYMDYPRYQMALPVPTPLAFHR